MTPTLAPRLKRLRHKFALWRIRTAEADLAWARAVSYEEFERRESRIAEMRAGLADEPRSSLQRVQDAERSAKRRAWA